MIASNSASSSENDVRIRHAVRGLLERISRHAGNAAAFGESYVEDGDVGIEGRHSADRLVLGARLTDNGDVAF